MTLTTVQMIQQIRSGQKAKALYPLGKVVVQKDNTGAIVVVEDDYSYSKKFIGKPLPMSGVVLKAKWELEPIEITFETALTLLAEGLTVRCYLDGIYKDYNELTDLITFKEAMLGKWVAL